VLDIEVITTERGVAAAELSAGNDNAFVARPEAEDDPHSLSAMLDTLELLCVRRHGARISIGDLAQMLGTRSFAPVILAIGLIALTPAATIPTLPTTLAVIVILLMSQMLTGFSSPWLPAFVARRSVNADLLKKAIIKIGPVAHWADRHLRSRLTGFTQGPFLYAIAFACAVLAGVMPILEFVPLVAFIPAAAFTAFGIALLLHDGAAALAGFALSATTVILVGGLVHLPF
jgi:hypothetical protein